MGRTYTRAVAAVPPQEAPLTYDDLQRLPDDSNRYELLDGYLLVTPSPEVPHQLSIGRLVVLLSAAAAPDHMVLPAPTDWFVSDTTVLQPDVIVTKRTDVSRRRVERPPLLAVEVLSSSTRARDLTLKRAAYERAGVASYWIVDPKGPGLTVLELGPVGRYQETRVRTDERFDASRPFPVSVVPAELFA